MLNFLLLIIRFFELELELEVSAVEVEFHQSVVRPVWNVYEAWLPWKEIVCFTDEPVFITTSEYLLPTAYATTVKSDESLPVVLAAILDPTVVPSSEVNALAK